MIRWKSPTLRRSGPRNIAARQITGIVLAVFLLCWAGAAEAAPAYPLKKSPNGRYFVDQAGVPVLVHGEAPWSLIGELTREEVIYYLDDCAERKFNSLIVTSPEGVFTSNPPNNAYGVAPFLTPGRFDTPNEPYFEHADWVIQEAANRGIQIVLAPAYLGHPDEGWYDHVRDDNTEQMMREYGVWVGNRYKNTPNLMFHWGNEPVPLDVVRTKVRAMAQGLRSVDASHLTTYHSSSEESTYNVWNIAQETWLDFNNIYTYQPVWQSALNNYAFSPTTPFILFESKYENEHGTTGKQQRIQAYQALLSGAAGHFYGNSPIWHMGVKGGNWQAALDDPGRLDMMHVRELFESRAWYRLVPDVSNTILTAGHSTGDDRATAALTDDGATLIVYAPSRRTLTVNLNALSGSDATISWFNPRDGSVYSSFSMASAGSQSFTPPSLDDWVLVIDDSARMFGAPGSGNVVPDPLGGPDGGTAGSGGAPYVYVPKFTCSSSTPGGAPWVPAGYMVALGAWVLVERRRRRRGA